MRYVSSIIEVDRRRDAGKEEAAGEQAWMEGKSGDAEVLRWMKDVEPAVIPTPETSGVMRQDGPPRAEADKRGGRGRSKEGKDKGREGPSSRVVERQPGGDQTI